jgi:hypothetical protein
MTHIIEIDRNPKLTFAVENDKIDEVLLTLENKGNYIIANDGCNCDKSEDHDLMKILTEIKDVLYFGLSTNERYEFDNRNIKLDDVEFDEEVEVPEDKSEGTYVRVE